MKKFLSVVLSILLIAGCFSACVSGKSVKEEEKKPEYELAFVCDYAYNEDKNNAFAGYEALCRAVINGEDGARLNTDLIDSVRNLFFTSFPLNALVEDVSVKEDGSGVAIKYKNEKEAHLKAVADFTAKIKEITTACASDNKNIYAINVYHYITSNIKESKDMTVTCYDTVMKGEGTSFSYGQLLAYLLMLGGIEASFITALDASNTGWGLCQVKLMDKYFYLDPMTEYFDNGGTVLRYFGMTDSDLKKEGLKEPTHTTNKACADTSDLYFDILRICKSYELQGTDLLVTTTEGEVVKIAL